MQIVAALALVAASQATLLRSAAPTWTPASVVPACDGIACAPIECDAPFRWVRAEDAGTCCPLCLSDTVKSREDRRWANNLTGGVGPNANADATLCRGVVCPDLKGQCAEHDQYFDGRCCTKCKSSQNTTGADFAQALKDSEPVENP